MKIYPIQVFWPTHLSFAVSKTFGPNPASFSSFSQYKDLHITINYKWIKRRCCAWDKNPEYQDGRCRRIHWAILFDGKILPTYGIRTKENQMKATSEALRLTARLISNCRIVGRVNVGLRSFVAVPVPIIRCRLRLQFHKKKFSSFFRAVARVKMSLINFLNVISLSKKSDFFPFHRSVSSTRNYWHTGWNG